MTKLDHSLGRNQLATLSGALDKRCTSAGDFGDNVTEADRPVITERVWWKQRAHRMTEWRICGAKLYRSRLLTPCNGRTWLSSQDPIYIRRPHTRQTTVKRHLCFQARSWHQRQAYLQQIGAHGPFIVLPLPEESDLAGRVGRYTLHNWAPRPVLSGDLRPIGRGRPPLLLTACLTQIWRPHCQGRPTAATAGTRCGATS